MKRWILVAVVLTSACRGGGTSTTDARDAAKETAGAAGTTSAGGSGGAAGTTSAGGSGGALDAASAGSGGAGTDGGADAASATDADAATTTDATDAASACFAIDASGPVDAYVAENDAPIFDRDAGLNGGAACPGALLASDDRNCAKCAHACPTYAICSEGACVPVVVNVVPAVPGCGQLDLAIADGKLYFADGGHGTINMVPTAGGPRTGLAAGEREARLVTVGGGALFWVATAQGTGPMLPALIRRMTLPCGPVTTIASETNMTGGIRGLTLSNDGATVYYSAENKVRALPATGGPAVEVARVEGAFPVGLDVDGNILAYTTDGNPGVEVVAMQPGVVADCGTPDGLGGRQGVVNCARVGPSQADLLLSSVILRGTRVIWANLGTIQSATVAGDGGVAHEQITSALGFDNITALAASPTQVYFSDVSIEKGELIERAPLTATPVGTRIAQSGKGPRSMVVDATRVYWSNMACEINATAL